MKCLIEELNKLDILPWGWVMLRRTPNTDPEDGFIELHYTGDTNLIEENAAIKRIYRRIQAADHPHLNLPVDMSIAMAEMTALLAQDPQ